jgi:REP element-mobilizing transposase RayT
MPQSLSKIYVHVIFSTKNGQRIIPERIREELQRYIIGCLNNIKSYSEEIYINPDHLHILCTLPRTDTTAQLISKMKTPSSHWLKEKGITNFGWQDGYAVFSVSASNVDVVKKYIQTQQEHHKKNDFKDELRLFFKNYNVDFDERYVWD